jgi:hypothetical protein
MSPNPPLFYAGDYAGAVKTILGTARLPIRAEQYRNAIGILMVASGVRKGLAKENKACTFSAMVGPRGEDSGSGHFGNAMK